MPLDSVLERLQVAIGSRYTIERELGRGGMATVYLAYDQKHRRPVALKVLRPDVAATLGAGRFVREIELVARFTHPHILPLHDSGEAAGFVYYVMPYVAGESLRDRLDHETRVPIEDALRITREVGDALSYAHALGVLHRDIKPENILLEAGHAVVTDFGIARAVSVAGGERVTQSGIVVGSPAYMSPEQAAGDQDLDARSDLYSLACVLYELLSGRPPHAGPKPQAILARRFTEKVPSLTSLGLGVSRELDAAVRRALAPAPADRFPGVAEFVAALAGPATMARNHRALPPWARRGIPIVGTAMALGAAVFLVRRFDSAARRVEPRLGVAVFPFRAAGGQASEWSETLADFLATALDGTPGVRVADPWPLWRVLRREHGAPAESPDPVEAERLARRSGVSQFVLGTVLQSGGRLDLSVRLYRAGGGDPLVSFAIAASTDSLPALVQRAAVEIIAHVGTSEQRSRVPNVESYTTRSADALKAYLQAKEAMRRGLVDSADAAIDRALALDSTFALALVEATIIKSWAQYMRGQPYSDVLELAERAVRHSDSLSERNRLRAQAAVALIRTDGTGAAEALGRIVQVDSTDLEAWDALSYCHLVYGWQYGHPAQAATAAVEHVLRLDSTYVPGLVRRAHLAGATEDPSEMQSQLDRLRRIEMPSSLVRGAAFSLQALLVDDRQFAALVDSVAGAPVPEWLAVVRQLRSQRPDRAELLLTTMRAGAGPGFPNRAAIGAQAQLFVAEGRLRQVDSALRAGAYRGFPGLERRLDLGVVTSAIAGVQDSVATQHALASLAAYVMPDSARAYFETRPVWEVGWAVAAYHAMFGDTAVTRRWRGAIGTLPAGGTSPDYRGALQRDLDARLAVRRGDFKRALALTREAYDLWSEHTEEQFETLPEPAMRFQLGLLLRTAGYDDSAAALLRSLVPPTTWMGFLTARASLELGELSENRGDRRAAARYYADALALWNRGGPEVAGWRQRALTGLRRAMPARGA